MCYFIDFCLVKKIVTKVVVFLPCRIRSSFVSNLAIIFEHPFFKMPVNTQILNLSFEPFLTSYWIPHQWINIWHMFILRFYESHVFNFLKIMFWQNAFPEVELVSLLYVSSDQELLCPESLRSWPYLRNLTCSWNRFDVNILDFHWHFIRMRLLGDLDRGWVYFASGM